MSKKTVKKLINDPAELRQLPEYALKDVAANLRQEILGSVSRNGGHLASSLGAVELIVALHRVFDTPREKIFFDVGHQAYAHKLLTGRREKFARLRQVDGVSGFINPAESEYDSAVSGHSGVALSEALGYAAADPDAGEKVIAVVGDGSAGNGGSFEALNQAASSPGSKRLIIILNDNRMSISGNVGAVSHALHRVIAAESYNRFRSGFKKLLTPLPRLKALFSRIYDAGKSLLLPPAMLFETLGIRYFGAINGNDLDDLLPTLKNLRRIDGPVLLHIITTKGYGCDFAASDPTRYHGISGCDPESGKLAVSESGFSASFGNAMTTLAAENEKITAVCPAMIEGTGLAGFAARYPERCFDVGIAENHAITFAAGLALGGKRPVCAFYDTFLQRALDAVYHDIVLPGLPVVIAVDRAGAVPDGPTHHGIFNNGFLRALPGITILAPAHEKELESALRFAVSLAAPVVIRYPRGKGASALEAIGFTDCRARIRKDAGDNDPVIWACGAEVGTALSVAETVAKSGISCRVIDVRALKPFDREMALENAARRHFVIEDHGVSGGLASALHEALAEKPHAPVTAFGWSADEIVPHGKIADLRRQAGLDVEQIAEKVVNICKNI